MSKKSIDTKVARKFVIDNRAAGKTDQEIYNELAQQYYDKKAIALLITGTVTEAAQKKYGVYNTLLIVLLGVSIVFKIWAVIFLSFSTGSLWLLVTILIVPILNVLLIYEIARYRAAIYPACAALAFVGISQLSKATDLISIIVDVILIGGIAGLSIYLSGKLFPNYGAKKLQKDIDGEYIL